MTVIELLLSLAAILGAAVLFTNAVEILGERLEMGSGSVGSILAAVGTALPETMIPVVAIFGALFLGRDPQSAGDIGIGAILGAPFLLTTLAMFVVGASVLGFSGRRGNGREVTIDRELTGHDTGYFLICFTIAAGAGIVALPAFLKILLGIALVAVYGYYVWEHLTAEGEDLEEVPESLYLWPGKFHRAYLGGCRPASRCVSHNGYRRALLRGRCGARLRDTGHTGGAHRAGVGAAGDGAAGEVQLYYLGQRGQGCSGARQHYRGHGFPEYDTGYSWFDLYAVDN